MWLRGCVVCIVRLSMRDEVGCVVKTKSARKEATFVVLESSKLNCHNFDDYLMSVTLDLRCCNIFERFTYSWWAYLPGTKVFADSKVYALMTACLISTCILIRDANAMSKGSSLDDRITAKLSATHDDRVLR
ncbi:hypothetical protein ARMGADRAFT_1038055 [Armillaria gallica]|uniref:Uncharacterized protein n=1 Tax=Armillaria gallica TaxID=47427 RepID=A0A2H3CJQ7_ARMGA|nr:hypothetical protein ARMGADRAFT_1038055 [Armillaria gallica]